MSYGLYIHLPFCRSRCPYCAFVSSTDSGHLIPSYLDAIHRELDMRRRKGPFAGKPATIYIGGGTPSLVPAAGIAGVLRNVAGCGTSEITVESNPESISPDWLDGVRQAGVNRLSIGIQSMDDSVLARLGRIHDAATAVRAFAAARDAGFDNISVDLIYGVPGQSMRSWSDTIERVIDLAPEHVSCYALSIEEDSGYFEHFNGRPGLLQSDGMVSNMYCRMREFLGSAGYAWYEISNLAMPGKECLHNMRYWDFTPYLGVGASAHSFDGGRRFWNIPSIDTYIKRVIEHGADPEQGSETLDNATRLRETIMLSLRTGSGLDSGMLLTKPVKAEEMSRYIRELIRQGCARSKRERIVLTSRGAMISDEICADIFSRLQI